MRKSRFSTSVSLYLGNDTRQGHRYYETPIESVVSSKTIAEFKRRLSKVDLSSVLRYNFNNSTGYT